MAVAQGLLKQTVFAKQSGLGSPASTGGKIKRRTASVFSLNRDTYENNEIASHQQSTGATAGVAKTAGKLDGLLSPGTYSEQFYSLVRKSGAATANVTGMTVAVAGSGPTWTLTRSAGSFITDSVNAGDVVRLTAGGFNAANLNKNLLVISLTATVLTVKPLSGLALVAESGITGATLAVPGKKAWAPTSGHTNDYWSVEEWYSDLSKSELFTDVKIAKADVALPATGNATVSFDCPGLGRTRGTAQAIGAPAAETTTNVLTAVNGVVVVDGTVTPITGAQLSIDGKIQPGEAEVGSNAISDMIRGEISVSGQFMAKFSGTAIQAVYDAQTVIKLFLVVADSGAANADFIAFTLPAVKIFGDAADDGEAKEIIRTYPFTAQMAAAAAGDLQTIISIQDSQAV